MIPQHLHVVWLGSPMPEWARSHLALFLDHNESWAVSIYDEWPPPEMPKELAASGAQCSQYCQLADLIYIWALATFGGVVMDLDSMTRRCFDPLLEYPAFSTRHDDSDRRLTNGVMGGNGGAFSEALEWIIQHPPASKRQRCAYGPDLMTRMFDQPREGFKILHWSYFYPLHCGERELANKYAAADPARRETLLGGLSDRWLPHCSGGPFAVHLWGCEGSSHVRITDACHRKSQV